jgi:phytoene dehydrogenase-like protein
MTARHFNLSIVSSIDKIFTTRVNRTLPGLDKFFMAGQGVVPGGGVSPTLVSGKPAAMLLCRRDGKAFRISGENR